MSKVKYFELVMMVSVNFDGYFHADIPYVLGINQSRMLVQEEAEALNKELELYLEEREKQEIDKYSPFTHQKAIRDYFIKSKRYFDDLPYYYEHSDDFEVKFTVKEVEYLDKRR